MPVTKYFREKSRATGWSPEYVIAVTDDGKDSTLVYDATKEVRFAHRDFWRDVHANDNSHWLFVEEFPNAPKVDPCL